MAEQTKAANRSGRFWRISAAGIFFQGGSAAVDSSTIIASLVHSLTGSPLAVGAASAILRFGWLSPQLFVAYFAHGRRKRMPFYIFGAFGRATCLLLIAVLLAGAGELPLSVTVALFFVLWTAYAFVSGVVAVPYNDIVARSVSSERRSRLLAVRFFGGGVLALAVAAIAHELLNALAFPAGYAALVFIGAGLLFASSISFVSAGETKAPTPERPAGKFVEFLHQGLKVFRIDRRFRLFVFSQWLGGLVMMSMPFYVLQVIDIQGGASDVAVLLAAQTAGALASNALWGWWGDARGKRSLLEGVAGLRAMPPLMMLVWSTVVASTGAPALIGFVVVFLLLGALGNGITIAILGYLMEISPDARRPAYSGYFNALVAPAALLPIAGAVVVTLTSLSGIFILSLVAAGLQYLTVRRLRHVPVEEAAA